MVLYIARDKSGDLFCYTFPPVPTKDGKWVFSDLSPDMADCMQLPSRNYKDVTFESGIKTVFVEDITADSYEYKDISYYVDDVNDSIAIERMKKVGWEFIGANEKTKTATFRKLKS